MVHVAMRECMKHEQLHIGRDPMWSTLLRMGGHLQIFRSWPSTLQREVATSSTRISTWGIPRVQESTGSGNGGRYLWLSIDPEPVVQDQSLSLQAGAFEDRHGQSETSEVPGTSSVSVSAAVLGLSRRANTRWRWDFRPY